MGKNNNAENLSDNPDDFRVSLSLDDGRDLECAILTIWEVENQDYIALVPVDENDEPMEEGEVFFFQYFEDEDGNPSIGNIESPDEFERVSDSFDEMLDEQDFYSMD